MPGFRKPKLRDICPFGNRRLPGKSVRLSVKTESCGRSPEIGGSPKSVIISRFSHIRKNQPQRHRETS
ncbi:Uncharacterized protein dnm_016890 [Desulfonema magnum]|uniref:Uncharacterized protein n=1 Tax=Desulfonema magnum TaxID=45655 RepID=A0A975BIG7_9BACT|nr:Uncharacterized protein dnm_016890 [Desulfonema magnum]